MLELSPRQEEILVGTLLGDACLARHGRWHRLHVKHKIAHRSLAEFKREAFEAFVSMPLHEFDQQLNGRGYPCVQFASRTAPVFTKWHESFYQGRRKTVPEDISRYMAPLTLAVWIMDDGAADFAGLTLQTHSFAVEEVEFLREVLGEKFGLAARIRANRGSSIIYVTAAQMPLLREIVEPHLLEDFSYKLIPRRSRTP